MGVLSFARRRPGASPQTAVLGHLDSPSEERLDRRPLPFAGWALEGDRRVAAVDVVLNGKTVIPARMGIARPDVTDNLRLPPCATDCGWGVVVDMAPWSDSAVQVQAVAESVSGTRVIIADKVFSLRDELRVGDIEDSQERTLPEPSWPWRLPESLAETTGVVIDEVSSRERMPSGETYLDVGRSALKAIRFAQLAAGKQDIGSILDMPCGHGRVLRWLKAAYPQARLTACDLITDGVDFCAATFSATPVYSRPFPTVDMFEDRYDLIFVGSLLTHVDVRQWDHLIALWHDLLNPDGLLVVTTHGELVAERMRAGHTYGYPASAVTRTLRTFEHAGFAFLEEPPDNIDYGITVATVDWTIKRLLQCPDFRVVLYGEALWDHHQDVAAVVKRPLGPSN